jgi:endonuclease YncB( thermonuclease family)
LRRLKLRNLHPDYRAHSRFGFILEIVVIAFVVLGFVAILCVAMVRAEPVASSDIRVIDGDTVAIRGMRERIRLVGFKAPETRNEACSAELRLGYRAKRRLFELVR